MKKTIRIVVIIAIIGALIIAYNTYRKKKNTPEWRTDTPSTGNIREVVTATGSLNPHILVNVGTEVSGKIEKIYKDYNAIVKKGDLLAKLDTELLETNMESAKGDLARAKSTVEEAKLDLDILQELYKKEMTPEYDLKKAEFKHQQAVLSLNNSKLALQKAQKNLDNAYIVSPINGVIVSRSVDEGQTVAASLNAPTLFIIANNLEQMQITASVDEADIGKISLNLPVEFTVDAYTGEKFFGKINQIRLNPNSDQNVVSYNVIIDAQNPERKLLPGMTANVTIVIQKKESVLRIPESATRFRPSKELWKLFGLKWDEELLSSVGRRSAQATSDSSQKSATSAKMGRGSDNKGDKPTKDQIVREGRKKPDANIPDSVKAKMAKRMRTDTASPANSETFQLAAGTRSRRNMRMAQVWVLEKGVPVQKMVRVGLSDGAFVEVLEGIEEGMQLVTGVVYKNAKQSAAASSAMQSGPGMGRRF